MAIQFEWDREKAALNLKKHRVCFDEAATVFYDPFACIFDDKDHSIHECREIIIGHSALQRLLIVCFTARNEKTVRLFSARLTTKKERKDYEENI